MEPASALGGAIDIEVAHDVDLGIGLSDELNTLIDAASAVDGHAPFGEHVLLTLDGQRRVRHARIGCRLSGRLVGYLVLCEGLAGIWYADLVTLPTARDLGVGHALLTAAAGHVGGHGGGLLRTWAYSTGAPDALAARLGMRLCRAVDYQTRTLVAPPAVPTPRGTVLRCLRPAEADAWLHLSNQAFEGHPENGGWTAEDLRWRLSAPWTDLRRFIVAADRATDELLAGVWTKADRDSTDGELYVVAVRPDQAGRGLGRAVVAQALRVLAAQGLRTASLYVDTANTAARKLYASFGFATRHTDRCFEVRVT